MSTLSVGVTITTHNRLTDLQRTLAAVAKLDPAPHEVWVCADGCADGTVDWLQTQAEGVKMIVNQTALGSVESRNRLSEACRCDLLLSLDDDSYPLEADFVLRISALFLDLPEVAVAYFPQRSDEFPESLTATDFGPPQSTGSYVNSGAVIRRKVFHELGAYAGFFFHAYEEPDFALRCIASGYDIRYEPSLTIRHHYTTVQRSELRTHQRHARNEIWSVMLRCPFPMALGVAAFRVLRQFRYAMNRGISWAIREPIWWGRCLAGLGTAWRFRQPVSWSAYWKWMQILRSPSPAPPIPQLVRR